MRIAEADRYGSTAAIRTGFATFPIPAGRECATAARQEAMDHHAVTASVGTRPVAAWVHP